mmetsp:Transcript_36619/g.63665  ORF Transcript_36619/g.63665 Transcript_36619/m.63665 type:complete len:292 (-) Transcript_36619:24-899(-)
MSGFGDRLNQRQKGFKKLADAQDVRRKREDDAEVLRKQKREETLQKKRHTNHAPLTISDIQIGVSSSQHWHVMEDLVQTLRNDCSPLDAQFQAMQQLRQLLSVKWNAPIQEVISTGILPRIVDFMKDMTRSELQFEAAWVLTNIVAGTADQTLAVVEAGALPVFINLLSSANDYIQEKSVCALGNIAGDSSNLRDFVLQSGGLRPVINLVQETRRTSMRRNATWVLSNLCRGRPHPPLDWIAPSIPILAELIFSADVEVLRDACWAFSFLCEGEHGSIEAVLQAGVCQRLF